MKKNIYLILITVITVACIFYGTYSRIGKFRSKIKLSEKSIEEFFNDDEYLKENYEKFSLNLDSFNSIEISSSVSGIQIEPGKDFSIYSKYKPSIMKPEAEVRNGTLYVTQKQDKMFHKGSTNCNLVITIPENVILKTVKIESNVGEIDLEDIYSEKVELETNVGQITVNRCEIEELDCTSDVGSIKVLTFNSLSDYNIEASTGVGEITVESKDYKHHMKRSGDKNKSISCKTNIGEITID